MKCIILDCAHKHKLSHNYGSHGVALSEIYGCHLDNFPVLCRWGPSYIYNQIRIDYDPILFFPFKGNKGEQKCFSRYCQHFNFLFPILKKNLLLFSVHFGFVSLGFFNSNTSVQPLNWQMKNFNQLLSEVLFSHIHCILKLEWTWVIQGWGQYWQRTDSSVR